MTRRIPVISLFACLSVPLLAHGQITYTTQARTVSASATGSPSGADESAIQSAPDFNAFNGEVHTTGGVGVASQNSVLGPSSITDSGDVFAFKWNTRQTADALSNLDVHFSLAEPQAYSISGSIPAVLFIGPANRFVRLVDDQERAVFSYGGIPGFAPQFNGTGQLPAGNYELQVFVSGHDALLNATAGGSYNVTFTVPEPATAMPLAGALIVLLSRRRCVP